MTGVFLKLLNMSIAASWLVLTVMLLRVFLKKAPGWSMVMPCCITNGYMGYFPMQDAYDEGGYEARTSRFKAGVAERIIAEGTKLLNELL